MELVQTHALCRTQTPSAALSQHQFTLSGIDPEELSGNNSHIIFDPP
jgi:hypothetical protein